MLESRCFDVLVVGAGPAGLAAAVRAVEAGGSVALVDDNPNLGGQIWRGGRSKFASAEARFWIEVALDRPIEFLSSTQIVAQRDERTLLAERDGSPLLLEYQKLILATGARERFLPFPGWTLPNVLGAGGLQALVKSGLPISGKRVVVAGSGPLLLAVAAAIKQQGAKVCMLAEQAPLGRVLRFGLGLWRSPDKLAQALDFRAKLSGVPIRFGTWPTLAEGVDQLESVKLSDGRRIDCDYLACGFGLIPNVELADLLGCSIDSGRIVVDEFQRTSLPDHYAIGESTGIGGLESALLEGQIAGYSATGAFDPARKLFRKRDHSRRFAAALDRAFLLRDELKSLASDKTIVCRCEDVRFGELKSQTDALSAKLQTRCGMGPCQGRICGPAVEFLFGWGRGTVRPPTFPVEIGTLAGLDENSEEENGREGVIRR